MNLEKVKISARVTNADWKFDLSDAAMNTVNKTAMEGREITEKLWEKYILSEHSPIRGVNIRLEIMNVPVPISVHLVRHVHSIPYVSTNRPDRTKRAERSVDDTANHKVDCNVQSLIDMFRKRLCEGKVSADTYEVCCMIKEHLCESDDMCLRVIGNMLVPNCVYRGGCPEFTACPKLSEVSTTLSLKQKYEDYTRKFLEERGRTDLVLKK